MFARTCHGVKITLGWRMYSMNQLLLFMHKNKTSTCARVLVLEAKVDSFLLCV